MRGFSAFGPALVLFRGEGCSGPSRSLRLILCPLEEVDDDLCGEFLSLLLLIFGSDYYLIDLCASRFFSAVYIFDNEQNGCAGHRYEAIPLSDVPFCLFLLLYTLKHFSCTIRWIPMISFRISELALYLSLGLCGFRSIFFPFVTLSLGLLFKRWTPLYPSQKISLCFCFGSLLSPVFFLIFRYRFAMLFASDVSAFIVAYIFASHKS